MDRDELSKVLKTMPPNGAFWKYGNVTMGGRSRKAQLTPVIFPHWAHRARYTCRVCHQELGFSMHQGDSGITREQYLAGKFCGACQNGTTAFTVKDGSDRQCKRCHPEDTGPLEKEFEEFSEAMPMSHFGNGIDWTAALKDGRINPANSLSGAEQIMQFPSKLKQPLKLGTATPRSDVRFSHEDHFAELDCSRCHPDIFNIKQRATASFTMDSNVYGNFCGACHMLVAFPDERLQSLPPLHEQCHGAVLMGIESET